MYINIDYIALVFPYIKQLYFVANFTHQTFDFFEGKEEFFGPILENYNDDR